MNNCEHFSIRRAVAGFRDRDWMRNYPFRMDSEPTPEQRRSLLPPLDTPKFQWWYCQNCVKSITGSTLDDSETDNMLDGNNGLTNLDQSPHRMMNVAVSVVPAAEDEQTNIIARGNNEETGLPVSVNRTAMFDLNKPPLPELCEELALGTLCNTDDELPHDNRDCHIPECASMDETNKENAEVGGVSTIARPDETTGRIAEAVGALPITSASTSAHDDHPSSERTETDEFSDGVDYVGMDDWVSVPKRPKRYRFLGDLMKAKGPMSGNVQSGGDLNRASTSGPQEADHVQPSPDEAEPSRAEHAQAPQDDLPLDKSLPISIGKCQTGRPNKSGNLVVPRKRRVFGNEVSSTGGVSGKADQVQSDGGPWKRLRKPLDDNAHKQSHNPVVQKEKSPLPYSKESASKEQRSSGSKLKQKKFKKDARVRDWKQGRVEEAPAVDTSAGPNSQLQQHGEESMCGIHLLSMVVAAETADISAVQEADNSGVLMPFYDLPEEDLYPLDTMAPLNSGVLELGYSGCTEAKAPQDFLLVVDEIEQYQLNPDHICLRPRKKRPAARQQQK